MQRIFFVLPLFILILLGVVFSYRLILLKEGHMPDFIPSVMLNRPLPNFNLPQLDAKKHLRSVDVKGKVTLITFFASWCTACIEEQSLLHELKDKIRLVGISYKDKPEATKKWLEQLGNPYDAIAVDLEGRTGIDFGLYGVPESYLIDRYGVIRFKQTGALTPEVIENQLLPVISRLNK
jgi:DsbE subfamily thiol:disulfide oxidoreductase